MRIIAGAPPAAPPWSSSRASPRPPTSRARRSPRPQLGNTQDVALRDLAEGEGPRDRPAGRRRRLDPAPGERPDARGVHEPAQIDGAWVPEPWATRLVQEGGGKVLVDERDLWPDGEFVTTHLIVRHRVPRGSTPTSSRSCSRATSTAIDLHQRQPGRGPDSRPTRASQKLTGKPLADEVIAAAWENLTFTERPDRLRRCRSRPTHADEVGLLEPVDLKGIYDLTLLNEVLEGRRRGRRSSGWRV